MDDGLGDNMEAALEFIGAVSILLVMDDGLGAINYLLNFILIRVSILLVMDDGLGAFDAIAQGLSHLCLNPSCNG